MILNSTSKFTSKSKQFNIFVFFLTKLTGKLCFWIQRYNLPEKMGKQDVFEKFKKFWLPVSTGKFMYKLYFVTIYQSTRAENAIVKSRKSRFTGKFCFWLLSLNLPVNFENSNFWPKLTGKFCFWNQSYNLPVKMGETEFLEKLKKYRLPVNTGKFLYK